ncbi:unnamed protein product [Rotaria sp. Silwood1]|nr:unnamed protein product [Rotaria sp. Silwood1]
MATSNTSCIVHDRKYLSKFHGTINQIRRTNEFSSSILQRLPKRCCTCHNQTEHGPDYHFWSMIPTLDQLVSLEIFLCDDIDDTIQAQLHDLLDLAPRLYSLKLRSWPYLPFFLTAIKSHSIRRLDFQGSDRSYREMWFSDDECDRLCRSTLGVQCEVLFIRVKHRQSILDLINRMSNLRALNVQCQDNRLDESDSLSWSRDDELVTWFEHQLPLTWKIAKDPRWHRCIQMWVG